MCHLNLHSNKALFADDTSLLRAGKNLNNIAIDIEEDLVLISNWLKHNKLLLNVSKSNAMIFKWKYQRKINFLNFNIDSHENFNLEIKCDGESIPFVKKVTLLGIILDEYLSFDTHTISICTKVNWKISVLKKSSYLFDLKFRTTLYKLFILSKYDSCSTLFFHFNDHNNYLRLENNYCKTIKTYLNIKIKNLSIEEQLNVLKPFRLLPLRLRFFQNLTFFVFALMKEKRLSALFNVISSYLKERETRYFFSEPIFQTNLYKFSFVSITIKLLNNFIYTNTTLTETVFRKNFKENILFLYNKNLKYWT